MSSVWEEVKGRIIFKAATLYAAVSWGIIQIADILLPVLKYPDWIMSSMVIVAFSGFPVALIFGWMFDIRRERALIAKENESDVTVDSSKTTKSSMTSRLVEFSIILLFGAGAALLYFKSANQSAQANRETLPSANQSSIHQLMNPSDEQKTIAVLPFASFGSSQEDDYFADGLSEELLNVLARNKNLRVVARTSSFQYKNKNINVKTIARELGVQYILEGSVRRSGEQIRVTAQLIKADEDVHVFSSTWDKDTKNIFKVQDEIAQSVLETLEIKLLGKTKQQTSDIGTQNIAAFAEYSRGVAYIRNRNEADFLKAIEHLNKALTIDNNYAESYAMLAQTYLLQLSYGLIKNEKAFELAKPNIDHALKLNKDLPTGHAVKGLYHWQIANTKKDQPEESIEQLEKAKFHLNRAIELNPSNAEAYMWYGSILQNQGQMADGSELYRKAFEIDPQAAVVGFNRGSDLVRTGQYEKAMNVFNTIVRNNPNYANAYAIAGDVSYSVGQLDQAYSMYKKIADLSGDDNEWLLRANRIHIPLGQFELAQRNLDQVASDLKNEQYKKELIQLQAQLWLASNNIKELAGWVATFEENTQIWHQRLWRGFVAMTKKDWKYATQELELALSLSKKENPKFQNEMTVRTQLMLAIAWKKSGDLLRAESYIDLVTNEINRLSQSQSISPQFARYSQAALAALTDDTLQSLGLIRQAVQEGFVDVWVLEIDPIFEKVRQDPTYDAIIREFNAKIRLMRLNIKPQDDKFATAR